MSITTPSSPSIQLFLSLSQKIKLDYLIFLTFYVSNKWLKAEKELIFFH